MEYGGHRTDDGGRMTDDRGQRTDDGWQKADLYEKLKGFKKCSRYNFQ